MMDTKMPRGEKPNMGGCTSCRKQLSMLQALDFAIQETVLYLDAYPTNCKALEFYHQLTKKRASLVAEYEKRCAPLTMYGNESKTEWNWVQGPWPWEPDAN